MKRLLLIVVLFIMAAALLMSCIEFPEEPREIRPFCEELYEELLVSEPDLPKSYIGYCIQVGLTEDEGRGLERFCGFMVEMEEYLTIQECIQDLKNEE